MGEPAAATAHRLGRLANFLTPLTDRRAVRVAGFGAAATMVLFMLLRIGVMPAASAGDDLWYDESGYWLLRDGQLLRAIHDNAAGDAVRDFLPPMAGTFTAASFTLFGYTQFAVGIVPTASCALGMLLCILAVRKRFAADWGLTLALAVVPFFTPLLLKVIGHNRFEAELYLFFCAAMLAGAVRPDRRLSRVAAFLAGLLTGLATVSYYPAAPLVILTLASWTILDNRAWDKLPWFVAGGAAVLAGFALWIGSDYALFLGQMQAMSARYHSSTRLLDPTTLAFAIPALAAAVVLAGQSRTRAYAVLTVAGALLCTVSIAFSFEAALAMMLGLATVTSQPRHDRGGNETIAIASRIVLLGLAAMSMALAAGGWWVAWSERADRDYAAFERNLLAVMPPNHGGLVLIDRPAHLALRPLYGKAQLHHLVAADAQTAASRVLGDPGQAGRVEAVVFGPGYHPSLDDAAREAPLLQAFLARPHRTVWISPRGIGRQYVRGGKPYEVMVLIPSPAVP
jgi:hypothetical protein